MIRVVRPGFARYEGIDGTGRVTLHEDESRRVLRLVGDGGGRVAELTPLKWLMLAAPAAEGLLKIVVGRPRPEDVSMWFPSGHATAAAAFFGAVIYLAESVPAPTRTLVRIGATLVIVLVALARIVLRAHWPCDVLAGIALGLALASAAAELGLSDRAGASRRRAEPTRRQDTPPSDRTPSGWSGSRSRNPRRR